MRSDKRAAVAILTFVLFVFGQASASITGSISGVVRDKSGAVIAGATVVATDPLTGVQTTQQTDAKPGKTSIRAGYGIFYSAIEDATGFVEVGDAPYGLYYSSPERRSVQYLQSCPVRQSVGKFQQRSCGRLWICNFGS
jgi:hypothetical protein